MNSDLETIAKEVASYIEAKISRINKSEQKYKNRYDEIVADLTNEIESTKRDLTGLEEDGLTVNSIEMEGYLRCLIIQRARFTTWYED